MPGLGRRFRDVRWHRYVYRGVPSMHCHAEWLGTGLDLMISFQLLNTQQNASLRSCRCKRALPKPPVAGSPSTPALGLTLRVWSIYGLHIEFQHCRLVPQLNVLGVFDPSMFARALSSCSVADAQVYQAHQKERADGAIADSEFCRFCRRSGLPQRGRTYLHLSRLGKETLLCLILHD